MSIQKRITQETFDEVVQENIDEFDMTREEAVQDALQQFSKQGIDLSNIDTSTGEGRKELLEIFQSLNSSPCPVPDVPTALTQLQHIAQTLQKQHPHYRRNIMLMYHQGGLNALHAHLDVKEDISIQGLIIKLISDLSVVNIEIRDFFEPGGSAKINGIITKLLSTLLTPSESATEYALLESAINLCRIVAKSEKNKTALMRNGLGNSIIQIFQLYAVPSVNPSALSLLEKTTALLRELCIHNDYRSEMSSAFDNGKFFIKQTDLIPTFISMIKTYESSPQLASNTLLAMKAMVTTNEAVQIISLHGIIELLSNILSSYTNLIIQLVQVGQGNPQSATIEKSDVISTEEVTEEGEIEAVVNTKKKTSPLLLLRSCVALIRNIIADDAKKEQFVVLGALQSLIILFLHSQKISALSSSSTNTNKEEGSSSTLSSNLSNEWNITNDYYLIEHIFGCFAQFTLRSPKNSQLILSPNQQYISFIPIMITYMQKYNTQDSLHRQICLMLHNIINRCPEYKTILLDYHIDEYLQTISGKLSTVKDESYVLLRDLGIHIQYMKMDENTGKLIPVYESFGNQLNKNFRPVFDETNHLQDRMVEESHAPFANEKDIIIEVKHSKKKLDDHDHSHEHDGHEDEKEAGHHDHSNCDHQEHSDHCCSSDHHHDATAEHSHDHHH